VGGDIERCRDTEASVCVFLEKWVVLWAAYDEIWKIQYDQQLIEILA